MLTLQTIYTFVTWGVTALVVAAVILILLRSLFNYLDVNPFTWSAINVRRATDPVILPVRRALISFRLEPKVAPFIAILLILIAGSLCAVGRQRAEYDRRCLLRVDERCVGMPVAIMGYLLFGLLGLYTLLIFVRIIFSWGMMGYGNRWMRFLIRITEPLLAPLRRMVPLVGMFDISPIVAFIILWLLQAAVASTLLRGWPVRSSNCRFRQFGLTFSILRACASWQLALQTNVIRYSAAGRRPHFCGSGYAARFAQRNRW